MNKYSGSEWLERQGIELSELGKEVADLLGQAYLGIYHIQDSVLNKKVDWSNNYWIAINIYGGLSTFDFDMLTRLVVMSFDRMIRIEVNPRTFRHLQLMFHKRKVREGDINERMPYLEDHIKRIRDNIGIGIKE